MTIQLPCRECGREMLYLDTRFQMTLQEDQDMCSWAFCNGYCAGAYLNNLLRHLNPAIVQIDRHSSDRWVSSL